LYHLDRIESLSIASPLLNKIGRITLGYEDETDNSIFLEVPYPNLPLLFSVPSHLGPEMVLKKLRTS